MMSFTSIGTSIDHSIIDGCGPYTFRIGGENYYQIGALLPPEGQLPRFAQLYIRNLNPEIGFVHPVDSTIPLELGYLL